MAAPRNNAGHDQNFVPTLIGVSTADGSTPVPVEVDPLTGAMQVAGGTGGGGSGGAVTVADGADVTQGAVADSAYTSGSGTVVSILKGIFTKLTGTLTVDTELPTAATLADATALPTTPIVGAANQVRNGAGTLDMQRAIVNGTNTSGAGVAAAGMIGQFDDVSPTSITENQFGNIRMSQNRNLYSTIRDAAGNERGLNINSDNTITVQPGNTANTTAWLTKLVGKSVSSQTGLTTTATVSGSAGTYVGGSYINLNSAPAYIQVFDTTGAVTLGTTVPNFVQPIPANSTPANGAAFVFDVPGGIGITNGIKIAATTTATGATTVSTALTGYTIYT